MSRLERANKRERRVLLALLTGATNLSGYPLSKVAQVGSRTVYIVLDKLEHKGWVVGERETGRPEGEPRRRFYRLTPEGRAGATQLLGLQGVQMSDDQTVPVPVTVFQSCPTCRGAGHCEVTFKCSTCNGSGSVDLPLVTDEQREVLKGALYDAVEYRAEDTTDCVDCDKLGHTCGDHRADHEMAESYLALARQLGIELEG